MRTLREINYDVIRDIPVNRAEYKAWLYSTYNKH